MSVAPGIVNLTFGQGTTWKLSMTYTDANDAPVDLTNYVARMQARVGYDAATTVLNINSNGSGITLGGTAGSISIVVPASTTTTIGAAQYVYDLELVSPSDEVTRLIEGTLTVTPEVTK